MVYKVRHKLSNEMIEELGIIRHRDTDYLYLKDRKQYLYDPKVWY